jgi:Tfp pilus assembly protein PilO
MAEKPTGVPVFWQKRTARERAIAALTALAVFSALLFQFPYAMLDRSLAAQQATVKGVRGEIVGITKQIADLNALAAEIKARGSAPGRGWGLVKPKGVFLFFEDVSSEAKRVGVNIVSVYPSQEVDKEHYKEVSMNLDLKARYREMAEYFKGLEDLPVVVNVRKIRVESCPDSASVCAAQIEAVAYVEK